MKTFREYFKSNIITEDSHLSSRHFGAGTHYFLHKENDVAQNGNGFAVKPGTQYFPNLTDTVSIPITKKIYITWNDGGSFDFSDNKLLHADINKFPAIQKSLPKIETINGKNSYVQFGIKSSDENDSIGYINLNAILKPIGITKQSRVSGGASAQEAVKNIVTGILVENNKKVDSIVVAVSSSTKPDLQFKLNNKQIIFEVKKDDSKDVIMFDKTVRRNTVSAVELNRLAEIFLGKHATFFELIDSYRQHDKTIGFPIDKGVFQKTGKLPRSWQNIEDPKIITKVFNIIYNHLMQGGNNYLAIYSKDDKNGCSIFSIDGNKTLQNTGIKQFASIQPLTRNAITSISIRPTGVDQGIKSSESGLNLGMRVGLCFVFDENALMSSKIIQ
jgi:hypothetical protein